MSLRRLPGSLGFLAAAAAGCALAYVAASLLASLSGVVLALFTRVELTGFQAQLWALSILTSFPSDGSRGLYALYHAGRAISCAAAIGIGLPAAARARGWLRLLLVYLVFWSGLLLFDQLGVFAAWRVGPLGAAARALWPVAFASRSARILAAAVIAAVVGFAVHLAIRCLLDGAAGVPGGPSTAGHPSTGFRFAEPREVGSRSADRIAKSRDFAPQSLEIQDTGAETAGSEDARRQSAGSRGGRPQVPGLRGAGWRSAKSRSTLAALRRPRLLALLGWLVLPALLVGWFALRRPHGPSAWRPMLVFAPPLFALLAGLPAVLRRPRLTSAFTPSARGGALLLLASSLTLGILLKSNDLARLVRRGDFVHRESTRWSLDFEAGRIAAADQARLAADADQRLAVFEERLGLPEPVPKLRARFYASADTKRSLVGSDAPFTLDLRGRTIQELLAPAGDISDPRGEALLLMDTAWGAPGSESIARAIARYAVGDFHDVPLAAYAARITREEGPYSLAEIFRSGAGYLSPLVSDALGGAWVASLVARGGVGALRDLYRQPLALTATLEQAWHAHQADNGRCGALPPASPGPVPTETCPSGAPPAARTPAASSPSGVRYTATLRLATPASVSPRAATRILAAHPLAAAHHTPGPSISFQRGISFSHEVGGSRGYGSDRAAAELAAIKQLHANSVAIVPYAFTRAPREPRIFFGTDERDDRVIRTIEQAKRLGLHVMLKPHLWGPVFTGDITFASDADFARWFDLYRRWMLHYARMAELYHADLLVIGNELGGLTGRETDWRSLIADLRRVYSGPLAYAASWGTEVGRVRFWDALDVIGVNFYYPLADAGAAPRPDSPRVRDVAEKLATLSQQYHRRVLFTEVGYPARATAAVRPWDESDGAPDAALQAQCYRTIFQAFYDQPWLAGMYWWKWPSSGEGSRFEISYSPLGKPALNVLTRWYGHLPERASPAAQ